LLEGKLREAEPLLEGALAAQQESLQPIALYNLGHVRFGQGVEELKKTPPARATLAAGQAASEQTDQAIRSAAEALAGDDVQKMVEAYLRGRGRRRELKAAIAAVRRALESHGTTLNKWQRAAGDFRSALELKPSETDARQNAEVVDRCIAKLVDTLRELQQLANAMANQKRDLAGKMQQLKGRIPAKDMPPGAAGDDEDEEEDQPMGPQPGQKEGPAREGEELALSPEQAAWLLEGFRLDVQRRLPMGQNQQAEPRNRNRPTW
jgi:tetratricopeptide (TPR) repeat protein